ncbi:poly(A)-specific ribonuclease PARN-like [Typha latifolia]|uniref:poly(A)-specific ribonuclease PARN-like n=1 Tax=Typha latifolia TaxID=4733 RepID=UPI003C2BAC4E
MAASGGKHRVVGGVVKQITKTNFSASLPEMKAHLDSCDFVAVSSQKTGDFGASSSQRHPWRRVLPVDTPETAYLKSKLAAESFELLQFAICPFRLEGSKVVAFPHNFHLFPRDELNIGMPSYSFSCQTSFLTSMAREQFDFNRCIYDGISYLSRVQESLAKERIPTPQVLQSSSCASPSVADSIFVGRIKSRVEHWRKACKEPNNSADGSLVNSLRKLILGAETFGSRPCLTVDVCSDRQVQLVLEAVTLISDDLVPLVIPDKADGSKAVRVVIACSDEDKNLLMSEIQNAEDEQNLKVRGFREVIDLISASRKPVISYNCLHDFTYIHSKFLAPLPPTLHEFMCSLRLVFGNVLDVSHLLKEISPLRKAKNIPAALSYLKRQFFVPVELETPLQAESNCNENHGRNVLRITQLFAKLNCLLKVSPDCQPMSGQQNVGIEEYANIFYPTCTGLQEREDEDIGTLIDSPRKVSTCNLVFLWGFGGTSATKLKRRLESSHSIFSEDFELQLLDSSCAVLVFWRSGVAEELLREFGSGSSALASLTSEGVKAAGFDAYKKVCRLGLWDADLAYSLENVLTESTTVPFTPSDVYWTNEVMLDLNDL